MNRLAALVVAVLLLVAPVSAVSMPVSGAAVGPDSIPTVSDSTPEPTPTPTPTSTTQDADSANNTTQGTDSANNTTQSTASTNDTPQTNTPASPPAKDTGHPKVEAGLLDDSQSSAFVADGLETAPDRVTVVVEARPGSADAAAAAVGNAGGEIAIQRGTHLQVTLPRSAIRGLAASPAIGLVRTPRRPTATAITSEGLDEINAAALHQRGYTGENVTVAVIDTSFDVTNAEIAGNVVEHHNFSSGDGTMANSSGLHGTAVSELVVDTAPNVSLTTYSVGTYTELLAAIDRVESRGDVDVVVMSMSWFGVESLDGTGPLSQEVASLRANGTLWVNSAGNYGQAHHNVTWSDPDGDDFLNFDGSDELLALDLNGDLDLRMNWDDWDARTADYDVYVYENETAFQNGNPIAGSTNTQSGSYPPTEVIRGSGSGTIYVAVHRADAPGTADFDLFFLGDESPEYVTSARSLTVPAAADATVAVGAVDYDSLALEPYSSRGPTVDGRLKPDLVAPDRVTTSADSYFAGTSAAAPHVGGVAALVVDATGEPLSSDELESALLGSATTLSGSEPNDQTGYGLVNATGAVERLSVRTIQTCRVIDTPGRYVLDRPLSAAGGTCLEVTSDDVVVEGDDHSVSGDGSGTALSVSGTNVTVSNLSVSSVGTAVSLASGANATLDSVSTDASENWTVEAAPQANYTASLSLAGDNVSVDARAVSLERNASYPAVPTSTTRVGAPLFTRAESNAATANLTVAYPDGTTNESSLRLHRHTGTEWTPLAGSVDTDANTVTANASSFGPLAVFELSDPFLAATPTDVSFGSVDVQNSSSTTVSVQNLGGRDAAVESVTVIGPNASAFAVTEGLPATLEASTTDSLTVSYTPPAIGSHNATLAIEYNGSSSPTNLSLSGSGVDQHAPIVTNATGKSLGTNASLVGRTGSVRVAADVTDSASGVASVTADLSAFGAGTVSLAPNGTGTYVASADVDETTAAGDGAHEIRIQATDAAGNTNESVAGTVVLDATNATLGVDSPANQTTNQTALSLNGTATDATSGVDHVEWRLDGGSWTTLAETAPWNTSVSGLADGSHTLEFRVIDNASNVAPAVERTVIVDTVAPALGGVSANRTTAVEPGGSLAVDVSVTDATSGVASVEAEGTSLSTTQTDASGIVTAESDLGATSLSVVARDAAGNENQTTLDYDVGATATLSAAGSGSFAADLDGSMLRRVRVNTSDTGVSVRYGTAPTAPASVPAAPGDVVLGYPQLDTNQTAAEVSNASVVVNVSDETISSAYALPSTVTVSRFDGSSWVDANATLVETTGGNRSYRVPVSNSSVLAVHASTESDAPNVTDYAPTGTVDSGSVTLSVAYDDGYAGIDPARASLLVDGTDVTDSASVDADGVSYTTDLGAGSHTAEITVVDRAGNQQTKSWSFETESTGGPSGSSTGGSAGSSSTGGSAGSSTTGGTTGGTTGSTGGGGLAPATSPTATTTPANQTTAVSTVTNTTTATSTATNTTTATTAPSPENERPSANESASQTQLSNASATQSPAPTEEAAELTTTGTDAGDDATESDAPGFGLVAALAALAAVVVLARRRG
ncbi:peptidase S8 and S53 subtilisin kexin sedolisin [Haloferax elongans ATCC BAA-1513]|uniref:Peptidase S8 and S53 subtilisin kexin sedolisin n=1 Tax=Haloferax elongans ATCC BAA-1513 TaxID=1230453 RepID=M0HS78_HALEO|nr:S8 family serine peptidase [Haloferax elongans]ELZ87351.1 peptidase S8 and S53 subtilisin kexin sedolisin [Haloferax elongans ATCC BAA-1513]